MVRHYIARYVESYFSQRMTTAHHALVLLALGLVIVPVVLGIFAFQLGAVVLAHVMVQFVSPSWIAFMVASAVLLAVAGYILARGLYELYSFFVFTWSFRLNFFAKATMSCAFLLDFLVSDTIMSVSAAVLSYSYLLVGINQRFGALELVNVSLVLMLVGLFFQVAFMSAYASGKNFSHVVGVSKRFVLTYPKEELQSNKTR